MLWNFKTEAIKEDGEQQQIEFAEYADKHLLKLQPDQLCPNKRRP